MRQVEINLADIRTKEDFHREVAQKLNFPDYYGRNLDAMRDCLTDITEDLEVVFFGVGACRESSEEMSGYIDALESMLNDVSNENDNLMFVLIAENMEDEEPVRAVENKGHIVCERDYDAIREVLYDLEIGEGDRVFASGFVGEAAAAAIKASGAFMIPVDIMPNNFGMDPSLIDFAVGKIREANGLIPKAIVISPVFGIPPRTEVIDTIAAENDIRVIVEAPSEPAIEDADYLARIGDAYKMAFNLRFGKGNTRFWFPRLPKDVRPTWDGFPIRLADGEKRDEIYRYLLEHNIEAELTDVGLTEEEIEVVPIAKKVASTTLVLPANGDMVAKDIVLAVDRIWEFFGKPEPEDDLNPFSALAAGHEEYGIR